VSMGSSMQKGTHSPLSFVLSTHNVILVSLPVTPAPLLYAIEFSAYY
jgi:hypothetical protein